MDEWSCVRCIESLIAQCSRCWSEMQRLNERIPSGMLSVISLITSRASTKLAKVCAAAREHVAKSRLLPELHLLHRQLPVRRRQGDRRTYAGAPLPLLQSCICIFIKLERSVRFAQAIKYIEENAARFNLKRTKMLRASYASHTPLMQDACEPFRAALAQCTPFQDPTTKTHKLVPVAYSA